jgi:hypothetical protein
MEFLVEGLVVLFWDAFTIEASLPVFSVTAGYRKLYGLWDRQHSTSSKSYLICVSSGSKHQAFG